MNFTIYNLSSGEITNLVECSIEDLILQVGTGESAIQGWSNDITQYIVNGVATDKPVPRPTTYNLPAAQAKKIQEIRKDCEYFIITGFTSIALSTSHLYPANDRDQVNLSGTIQKSLLPSAQATDYYPFLCADSNGVWDYRLHTSAQIQQVGVDAYNAILNARVKNATLQYQITQATNQEELDLIQW